MDRDNKNKTSAELADKMQEVSQAENSIKETLGELDDIQRLLNNQFEHLREEWRNDPEMLKFLGEQTDQVKPVWKRGTSALEEQSKYFENEKNRLQEESEQIHANDSCDADEKIEEV